MTRELNEVKRLAETLIDIEATKDDILNFSEQQIRGKSLLSDEKATTEAEFKMGDFLEELFEDRVRHIKDQIKNNHALKN